MLFNSSIFALFFAAVLLAVWAARGPGGRKLVLLAASYLFYAHWDYRYLVLLWISTIVDYSVGGRLHAERDPGRRRAWLLASLVCNLGLLALFKYGNFLLANLAPLWSAIGVTAPTLPTEIPIGISFYTFQTLSYTIDVYRRKTAPCRSPLDFALFVAFFPQLVAGPIVRAGQLLPQLARIGRLRLEAVSEGMQRFLLGLVKKLVIADGVALYVDHVFASPSSFSAPTLWFAAYGFALQIYCDFSGYTDMALGLGRAFGISLPENFRRPYLALSITDFWRRWHCSLSGWLRDYLYIPLGGSRRGTGATYRNLLITMLLGGLWHGAAWTFVAWGGYHGLLLAIERAAGERGSGDGNAIGVIIRRLLTFHLVCIGWVFFRAESFDSLWVFIARMFTIWDLGSIGQTQGLAWALLLATLVTAQGLLGETGRGARIWCRLPAPVQGAALALLVVAAGLLHVDRVAFIYFQF